MDGGGLERFGEALARLEGELDWRHLGELHCHEGGEDFFPQEQVDAMREAGLVLAAALGQRLSPGGRSLYVGAAIGELVVLLCESLVLGREVRALNLANEESTELNRALAAVEEACGFPLPRIEFLGPEEVEGAFDHGWLVSVLNDPEAFPALLPLKKLTPSGEGERTMIRVGAQAPEFAYRRADGSPGLLSDHWADGMALLLWLRHCG